MGRCSPIPLLLKLYRLGRLIAYFSFVFKDLQERSARYETCPFRLSVGRLDREKRPLERITVGHPVNFELIGNNKKSGTSSAMSPSEGTASEAIIGNSTSKIYHWPGCPNYYGISPKNQIFFTGKTEAETAGSRAARNCQ